MKYEEVYLKAYADVREARLALGDCFRFYNDLRPHQALGYRTPAEVFQETMLEAMNVQGGQLKERRCSPELVLASSAGAMGLSLN